MPQLIVNRSNISKLVFTRIFVLAYLASSVDGLFHQICDVELGIHILVTILDLDASKVQSLMTSRPSR